APAPVDPAAVGLVARDAAGGVELDAHDHGAVDGLDDADVVGQAVGAGPVVEDDVAGLRRLGPVVPAADALPVAHPAGAVRPLAAHDVRAAGDGGTPGLTDGAVRDVVPAVPRAVLRVV